MQTKHMNHGPVSYLSDDGACRAGVTLLMDGGWAWWAKETSGRLVTADTKDAAMQQAERVVAQYEARNK